MRKTTLPVKIPFYFWLCFLVGTLQVAAQCPVVTQPNQTFCDSQSPTVSSLQANANGSPTVAWFATSTSTTPLSPTAGLVNGSVYWVSNADGSCPRQSVTVTVYGPPTGLSFQGVCAEASSDATVSDLQAAGNNVQWYDAPVGGNLLNPTDLLLDDTLYYASQTNPVTGCETSRLSVFVNVHLVPVPTGEPIQQFCNLPSAIPTVADLQPNGSGYRWFATSSSSVPLPATTPLIDGESYYVTTFDPPCESASRFEVFVDLIEANQAGDPGTVNICENETSGSVDLFSYLGGSPDTTGSWSGPFTVSGGHLGTTDLSGMTVAGSPYVFTYTVSSEFCPTETSTVSVSILPLPVVTIAPNQTICSGEEATVTFTGTPNTVVVYSVNGGPNQSIALDDSGIATLTETYTTTTTIELVTVATTGPDGCTAVADGSVVITVLPLPVAFIASSQTVCSGEQASIVFTGTANATVIYTAGGVEQSIVLDDSGTAILTEVFTSDTTYTLVSVTSAGTPACTRDLNATIQITVTPSPVVSIASDVTVCESGDATITFTGTGNALVSYTVNGGAVQTILLNAAGTASLTQTYTETTTYTLVSVETTGVPACIVPASGSVTITVLPLPTATVEPDQLVCPGEPATITFTGTPNSVVSYTVNGGPVQTITLDDTGVATLTDTYLTTTTITLLEISTTGTPVCTQTLTGQVVISIATPPTATISSDQTICQGGEAIITFTGTPGATVNYTENGNPASVVLDAAGEATVTHTVSVNTVFALVSAVSAGPPSCTQPLSGQIEVSVVLPPVVEITSNQVICAGDSATVTFTGTPGAVVVYQINGGPNQTITLNPSGTASVTDTYDETTTFDLISVTSPGNICTLPVSGTVVITVTELPTAGIASSKIICENEQATITFAGTPNATVTYLASPGGTQTIVLDGTGFASVTQTFTTTTTFTLVSVQEGACEQELDESVTITVTDAPVATIASDQTVCPNSEVSLVISGTSGATVSYSVNGGASQSVVIPVSGTVTILLTVSETTTVSLSSVAFGDCEVAASSQAVITVLPFPEVSIAQDQLICSGDEATIIFTGTPGATIQYTVNGSPASIVLDATGTASVTDEYSVETVFELVTATLAGSPTCAPHPVSGSATIAVSEPPVVTISDDASVCESEVVVVVFNGTPGATVNFTINGSPQSIVLSDAGMATLSDTYTVTTVIALVSVVSAGTPGCTTMIDDAVTITVTQAPQASIAPDLTVCAGETATVTFTGTPGAIVTYNTNGGTAQTLAIGPSGVLTITDEFTETTIFTLETVENPVAPSCIQTINQTATVTVLQVPVASMVLTGSGTICEGESATVVFTGTPGAIVSYTVSPGTSGTITLNASGTAQINPILTADTVITLVGVTTGPPQNCSQDIGATLNVSVVPGPDAGSDVALFEICESAPAQDLFELLGPDAETGGIWSPALASGSGVFNPAVDAAGTYTYTVTGSSLCEPDTASVTVSVVPEPEAGADGTYDFCENQQPVDLFALLGSEAQAGGTWSPALSGGGNLFDPSADAPGTYVYTVTGVAPCLDDSASLVISVTSGPDAGEDGSLVLCQNSAAQDLFGSLGGTPQPGGSWTPALASGTGVFNPAVDSAGTYTYAFDGSNPCDNDSATVTVTVNPVPDAGENGSVTFCANFDPADLFGYLGGTPQTGGTWSPALSSGSGLFDPGIDAAGVYTYTVGGGFCDISTATVTVSILDAPNAGEDGTLTVCLSTTSVNLVDGLDGTQDAGTWEDTDNTGALSGSVFNTSAVGPGTYHFTYTVGGGSAQCETDTAIVTVIVEPEPEAGTFTGVQQVCLSQATFDLGTLLTGAQAGGVWNFGPSVITNPIDLSVVGTGTHTFTYIVTNSCGFETVQVQLTVNNGPELTSSDLQVGSPVCQGGSATVTLSGLSDGTYELVYELSGANTTASQTVTVTAAGGTASFPIPESIIPNLGATTISITSITNTTANCASALSGVQASFTVNPVPELTGATIAATAGCFGSDVTISLTGATALADGTYVLSYTIPQLTPPEGASGPVNVVGGNGSFVIPASSFVQSGTYDIQITGIGNGTDCGNNNLSIATSFTILPIPDLSGADLTAADICLGSNGEIIISGASAMADGAYILTYQLSGAATATGTATVDFAGGDASFSVPSAELTALGTVQIEINDIQTGTGDCASASPVSLDTAFEISEPVNPTLIEDGNLFCGRDNPTLADLSANVQGSGTLIWYDAPVGGNVIPQTQTLVHNTTYYAALNNGLGCESPVRLEVTVDLDHCDEILIPDGFSPNGDGINDEFVIVNLPELYPNFKLEIYNRYGNLLYKGDASTPNWNGTANQNGLKLGDGTLPVGVYFYILEFNDGSRKPQQGRVYLSR